MVTIFSGAHPMCSCVRDSEPRVSCDTGLNSLNDTTDPFILLLLVLLLVLLLLLHRT